MNGIINVYKEKGYTSHDVVAKLRGILKQKKIGHTGTLDPEAEGVLPVCVGNATKVCDLIMDKEKKYRAVLLLGRTTDTQDDTGRVLSEADVNVSESEIREAISGFVGEYDQVPPMYSAIKIGGRRLYELARKGEEVERPARRVTIKAIDICDVTIPRVTMEITCSKGTYIRTLCHDIGEKLGCGGIMESLLRTGSGDFMLQDARKLDEIRRLVEEGNADTVLLPVDSVFGGLAALCANEEIYRLLRNGNPVPEKSLRGPVPEGAERVRIYDHLGTFTGIFEYKRESKMFKPVKLFL